MQISRNFRRRLSQALRKNRREKARILGIPVKWLTGYDDNFKERYLSQQLDTLEVKTGDLVVLQPFNQRIVKEHCNQFNPKNPLCRCCRFYSTYRQEVKFGKACPYWFRVFGINLREMVIKSEMKDFVRLTPHSLNLWFKRWNWVLPESSSLAQTNNPDLNRRVKAAEKSMSEVPTVVIRG